MPECQNDVQEWWVHTHTHTHTHVYVYVHTCMRVCAGEIYEEIARQPHEYCHVNVVCARMMAVRIADNDSRPMRAHTHINARTPMLCG